MNDTGPIVTLPPDLISDIELFAAPTNLWHLVPIKPLWKIVTGKGIKVAVLDTGMNSHDILPEPIEARSFIQGESWRDGNGHGTHCSGTVLGREGIGLAPDASLMTGKVLSNGGSGSSQGIADGINWAVEAGADIISMSLGSNSSYAPMQDALKRAWTKGVIIVSAAGNAGFNGSSNTICYPAKFPESLCIGASASNGGIASFSSGGREMDIVCPGQDIISTSTRNGYVSMSGTSMATPFSAGLFALILELQRREGYAAWENVEAVRVFLTNNSDDKGAPGRDPSWGFGVPRYLQIVEKLDNATLMF